MASKQARAPVWGVCQALIFRAQNLSTLVNTPDTCVCDPGLDFDSIHCIYLSLPANKGRTALVIRHGIRKAFQVALVWNIITGWGFSIQGISFCSGISSCKFQSIYSIMSGRARCSAALSSREEAYRIRASSMKRAPSKLRGCVSTLLFNFPISCSAHVSPGVCELSPT